MADEGRGSVFSRFVSGLAQITSGTSSNTEELGGRLLALVREPPICTENSEKLDKIRRLVHKGASVNFRARESKYTALHFACLNSDYHAAQALIALGADVNAEDSQYSTPLHLACRRREGSYGLCKFLLLHGAEVDAQDSFGTTPLHEAAAQLRPQIAQLLLEHGASSNIDAKISPRFVGTMPETPFGIAVRCGLIKNILVFLKNGASFKNLSAPAFLRGAHDRRIKHRAARCLIEVGMHRSPLIPDYRAYREKFVEWPDELKVLLTQPQSLSGFCVQMIREVLGQKDFSWKVCSLALPVTLQNKVLYWDFDKIFEQGCSGHSIYEMPIAIGCL